MRRTDPSLTFAPLRVRSFRFQWPADLLTSWAFEMETLILGWYVMVDTGSVLLLTTFGSLQQLGTLAAPMFGVLGDRLGGRAMLCGMRASFALLAAILMILSLADVLTPAFVLVAAALGGILRPNDQVMRNALIGDTIPRDHLMGAVGMSRTTMDSARVAGALAGATLMATLGIGRAYVFVTIFYLASLALTFGVSRGRPVPDRERAAVTRRAMSLPRPSSWREMLDGLLYVWARPKMLATMWLAFLVNLTAYPASGGLLPYVARNIYEADANGLGWLVASFSFGALLGSIGMVVTGGPRHPERSMIVYTAIWYALLLAFGHVTHHDRRDRRAHRDRHRPEHRHDLDGGEPAARRRRPLPGPGDGRPESGGVWTAAGPDGSGRARRADRLPGTITIYSAIGLGPHRLDRREVALERVGARVSPTGS